MTNYGKVLKAVIAKRGFTIKDVGMKAGLPQAAIYDLTRGIGLPTVEKEEKIAKALDMSLIYFKIEMARTKIWLEEEDEMSKLWF